MLNHIPFGDHPLIVTEVLPGGWAAQGSGVRVWFKGAVFSTGRLPAVGDVAGFIDTAGTVFIETVHMKDDATMVTSYTYTAEETPVTALPDKPTQAMPRQKPYLALNRPSWQKRKKGR